MAIGIKKTKSNCSSKVEGTKGDNSKIPTSEPQTKGETDKRVVGEEIDDIDILKGVKLSSEITGYIAWKGINPEYRAVFYNVGVRKRKELYCISMAIRCHQGPT